MNKKHLLRGLALSLFALVSPTLWAYDFKVGGIYYTITSAEDLTVQVSKDTSSPYKGDITIPSTVYYRKTYKVTSIGERVFDSCTLSSITIPSSITYIEKNAFKNSIITTVRISDLAAWCGITFEKDPDSNPLLWTEHLYVDGQNVQDLVIPSKVTEIGRFAFYGCDFLKSVSIPNSVTTIGGSAFGSCAGLTSVDIPNSVTTIGRAAFSYCTGLTSFRIPDGVTTIGNYAFGYCTGLTSVDIPNSVITIGDSAFYYCSGLTSVILPNSVTTLGKQAFKWCRALSSVTLSENLEYIQDETFRECTNLKSIIIPNSVTRIYGAFYNCSNLESVTLGNNLESIGNNSFNYCKKLKNIKLPNTLGYIGGSAFSGCESLEAITIPNGVTSIGGSAFSGCRSLPSVVIPNSVKTIGMWAFYGCSGLKSVSIPNVTSLGYSAFKNCENLENLYINSNDIVLCNKDAFVFPNDSYDNFPRTLGSILDSRNVKNIIIGDSVSAIGQSAFRAYQNLTSVTIPNSVTSIGSYAFAYCGLTSLTIPNSITTIEEGTFEGNKFTSITIPNSITSIEKDAFAYCSSLQSVDIPNSITSIEKDAFCGCSSLQSVDIPNSITSIEEGVFSGCSSLQSVDIPNSVTNIGSYAFSSCGLTSVTLPNSITNIEPGAFKNCSSLHTVTLPNSVTSIGTDAFYADSALTTVYITDLDAWCGISFGSENSNPLNGAKQLFLNGEKVTDLSFSQKIKSIGDYTFYGFSGLNSLTIHKGILSISSLAFAGCSGLSSIVVEEGNSVFDSRNNCNAIVKSSTNELIVGCKNTIIDNSINAIGEKAFYGCKDLTSVIIPSSVTTLGNLAFFGCGLTSVTCKCETPPTVPSGSCFGNFSIPLIVPSNAVSAYKIYDSENYWKDFTKIYAIIDFADPKLKEICVSNWDTNGDGELSSDEAAAVKTIGTMFKGNTEITSFEEFSYFTGLTAIENGAFEGCRNMTSIKVPFWVSSVGDNAFSGCSALTSVTIEYYYLMNMTSIGANAFNGCSNLTSVNIPSNVTTVGKSAFQGCAKLASVTIPYGVKIIEDGLFNGCRNLASVTMRDSITSIGERAFYGCSSLASITIPENVTSIGKSAFQDCSSLASVNIPENVTSIEDDVFSGCSSLASITIPSGVTNIGFCSFANCSSLTELNIPNSVESIGTAAFIGCRTLTSITVEEGGYYDSRNNCNAIIFGDELVAGCVNTVIPSTVTSIGESAFNGSGLTSITIPGSITYIGFCAFGYCEGLETVTIPSSVASLGDQAFFGCTGLTSIICEGATPPTAQSETFGYVDKSIPVYVPNVALAAYRNADYWKEFTNIQMTDHVITFADANVKSLCVANWDTDGDGELSEVEAAAVTSIGTVFKGNTKIATFEELAYFTGLTSIGANAFQNCTALTTITVPDNVKSIGNYAFSKCKKLTNFSMPDNVSTIGTYAFQNCTALTEFTIPSGVTAISQRMFEGCTALKTVDIPNSVTTIGMFSFRNCSSLKSVIIPNSVTTIEKNVFESSGMTTLTIPNSVTTLGNSIFKNCTSVTTLICECVTPPTITYGTSIEPIPTSAVVKVPVSSLYAYQNDAYWNTYTNGNMQGVLFEPYMRNVSCDWGTVVLPYTTESTEDVQLYSLKSADLTEGILRLTPENTIPANTPCIFRRLDSEATTVMFPIVEQGSTTQTTVSAATEVDGWTFKGTYNDRNLTPSATPSVYYIADDQFQLANVAYRMAAFSGWFETAAPVNVQSFRIQTDEENTGIEDYLKGDANGDGFVDIADAVCIVNHIVGKATPAYKEAAADANGDGVVDIADAVRIVNLIVGKIDALARKQDVDYTLPDPE